MASFPLCHLAAVVTALGDYDLARAQLDEALQLCRSIGHQWTEGEALVTLSVLCYAQGEDELARHYAHQAVAVNQVSHNRSEEMSARAYQGHILARLGDLDAAAASYHQVLQRKQEWCGKGEPDIFSLTGFLHGLAGLARLALLQQQLAAALPYVEELLRYLRDAPLDLRLNPQLIYLICYRVLRAAGDPRAKDILTTAYQRLQAQAANIADETLRRSFLENVAEHRELAADRKS
jgi:tetratricopeptide (TPR) repeat protein